MYWMYSTEWHDRHSMLTGHHLRFFANVRLPGGENTSARNHRHSFQENKPKTLVLYDWKRALWACFRENWVYKLGHRKKVVLCFSSYIWGEMEVEGGKDTVENTLKIRKLTVLENFLGLRVKSYLWKVNPNQNGQGRYCVWRLIPSICFNMKKSK